MRVVATAGHVDHGKSSLVRALTGTDPDRFEEEQRRGLTIDLGFAHCVVDGEAISFVDVPGHVRFLRNMLAGVGGVDACLFVVAATEGWKPQSEEHLRILELVGVTHGIVALTKVDLLDDPELVELATLEVADHLAGTFLAGSPIVPVAAPSGDGLDDLAPPSPSWPAGRRCVRSTAGGRACGSTASSPPRAAARSSPARSTDGSIGDGRPRRRRARRPAGPGAGDPDPRHGRDRHRPGQPRRPQPRRRRSHRPSPAAMPSSPPGRWRPTDTLRCLAHRPRHARPRRVAPRAPTSPTSARASTPCDSACSGRSRWRRARPAPCACTSRPRCPLLPGDRYVLRETGRDETVGGGEVLDVAPVLPASRARPDRRIERVVAERGWVDADELEALTGECRATDDRALGRRPGGRGGRR